MYVGKIKFNSMPDIGFAMRHYTNDYKAGYGNNPRKCVEIAYVNSGGIKLCMNGVDMFAPEGSVVTLFRHLPIFTETVGNCLKSHDSVLAEFDDMEFFMEKDGSQKFDGDGLVIPFVSPPSERAEKIGIQLRQIVSDMTGQIESNEFCSSVAFVAVLKELADMYKSEKNTTRKMTEKNVLKIKEYIDGNIEKSITLSDIAHYVGRSPNHTGTVFKKNTGMTVTTYINMGKVKEISRLMKTDRMNFREACDAVSISDESYGYRLFKKYVGLTPREFAETTHIEL